MTVVVWDGKTLAADQYLSDPYGFFHVKKIGKLSDGSLYGWSGYPHQAMRVINWLNSVRNPDNYPEQTESDKSATVMVISKRKKVTLYNDIAGAVQLLDRKVCIGSGSTYAQVVLEMGGDAKAAVQMAIKRCPSCGGGIDTESFK